MKLQKNQPAKITIFFLVLFHFSVFFSFPGVEKYTTVKVVAKNENTNEWEEISFYNKVYGVIIGIDKYPFLSPDKQLSYSVPDAKAVEQMLKSKFVFHKIYTLYNEQATKSNIMDILLNRLAKISKNDAVFVFFAGHGGQQETDYGPIGYILPYDGNFNDMRTVILMTAIRDDISKIIKAKHIFFTMDSCYSGLLLKKREGDSKKTSRNIDYLKMIAREPVRQVLAAGTAEQKVLDDGPGGHSVFTGRFLEILDNADDYITASEISSVVKQKVFSDAQARGHVQTPQSGELFGLGDFIFMPSMTKKSGSIQQQIERAEKELEKIKEIEAKAIQVKNEAAARDAERKRKNIEAKIEAEKLKKQRLIEERQKKEVQAKKKQDALNARKLREEEDAQRLSKLKKEVALKREKYKTSMVSSLEGAIKEMQKLDIQINGMKSPFLEELKRRVLNIAQSHSDDYSYMRVEKDEFETEAEYRARLAKSKESLNSTNPGRFGMAMEIVQNAYNQQTKPLIKQLKEISNSRYEVYGHDALTIKLGKYNPEEGFFKIAVASKTTDLSAE